MVQIPGGQLYHAMFHQSNYLTIILHQLFMGLLQHTK